MTKLELCEEAINFAMLALCYGYLEMSGGCDECPIFSDDLLDEDENVACREKMLEDFLAKHPDEFEEK